MKTIKNIHSVSEISDLEKMGVEIEFTPEECDTNPSDLFENEEDIKQVQNQYNSGNYAAWFCAKVEVKFKGLEFTDYLGGCSYKSFSEFQSDESGYYVDMINTCLHQINSDIEGRNEEVQKAWDIRKAKNLVKPYGYDVFQCVWPTIRKYA